MARSKCDGIPWNWVVESVANDSLSAESIVTGLRDILDLHDAISSDNRNTPILHPLDSNIGGIAFDLKAQSTFVRGMAWFRKSGKKQMVLVKSLSVAMPLDESHFKLWNESNLLKEERSALIQRVIVSQSTTLSSTGQPQKVVSFVKQMSENKDDLGIFLNEMNASDLIRGSSIFGNGCIFGDSRSTLLAGLASQKTKSPPKSKPTSKTSPSKLADEPIQSLPAESICSLAARAAAGMQPHQLHREVTALLCDQCFDIDPATSSFLALAIPIMEQKLLQSKGQNRALKLAHEAAKEIPGFLAHQEALDAAYAVKPMNTHKEERLVFEGAISVLQLVHRARTLTACELYQSKEEFLSAYSGLEDVGANEQNKLFHFANFMRVCMTLLQPQGHKTHLIRLVTKLVEGKGVKYVPGGAATAATTRRRFVLDKEVEVRSARPRLPSAVKSAFPFIPSLGVSDSPPVPPTSISSVGLTHEVTPAGAVDMCRGLSWRDEDDVLDDDVLSVGSLDSLMNMHDEYQDGELDPEMYAALAATCMDDTDTAH